MKVLVLTAVVLLIACRAVAAIEKNNDDLPTLLNRVNSTVTVTSNTVTVTFGPIDISSRYDDHIAAGMPKHFFALERDVSVVGFKLSVFTKDGSPLPRHYLHHISLWDMSRKSTFCPGAPYNFAGAGNELTHARFPTGYGVKLKKGAMILAVAHFYHDAPPVKEAMASITLAIAPDGGSIHPMEAYHVSVNTDCHTKLSDRPKDESDEGIELNPGLMIRTAPVKFRIEGCVKAAYPHGHDQLALITLEDKTTEQTLLRTVPTVASDGSFLGFASHQVFEDDIGFSIEADHEYEMTMIYHRLLHDERKRYGMADYLMYLTPGECNRNSHAESQ
ncbi:hypothetical protein [Nitrospira sp. Nam74]